MKKTFLLSFLLLNLHSLVQAQLQVDTIALIKKMQVLNGRASFLLPATAISDARSVDIMSAAPDESKETRIIYDLPDMIRLVFFAQELFKTGSGDLLESVKKGPDEGYLFSRKKLTDKDGLLTILSTPTKFDSTEEAILVNSLVVRTADNTLFRIDAYISTPAYKWRSQFITLSEKVFQTIEKGARSNNIKAHKETYPLTGTQKQLSISLPDNFMITMDQQYDFQVLTFHEFNGYNDTTQNTIVIYAGNHPSFFHEEYQLTKDKAKIVKGYFLSKKAEWLRFILPDNSILLEQHFAEDALAKDLIIHAAMIADSEKELKKLQKIMEAIKVEDIKVTY